MAYDGAIQFDIAMDIEQFKQGLAKIVFLLENISIEGTADRLAAQLDMSEAAGALGERAGQSFTGGLLAGTAGVAADGGAALSEAAFGGVAPAAFSHGQRADSELAKGLATGQGLLAAHLLAAGIHKEFAETPPHLSQTMADAVAQVTEHLLLGYPMITHASQEIANGVQAIFEQLASNTQLTAAGIPRGIEFELYAGAPMVLLAAREIANDIADTFAALRETTADIMPQVFSGMGGQMDALAPALYQKATAIANEILQRLRRAFNIHSPSKETQEIAGDVMLGLLKGFEQQEKAAYQKVEAITEGILQRFEAASRPALLSMSGTLQSAVQQSRQGGMSNGTALLPSGVAGSESQVHLGGLTQNFYAPKAPSPAEATQQGMAFLEQARWKLPQMAR